MEKSWHCPLRNASLFARLDWLFYNMTRFLKSWSDKFVTNGLLQLTMAKEVVACLEAAGDHRPLGPHEEALRKELKLKMLGLSSLQRTIAMQEAHVRWLHEGGTPTKFFHAHMNARKRHNFIHVLEHNGGMAVSEDTKADATLEFFEQVLATPSTRVRRIKLDRLDLPRLDLTSISSWFIEEEVWSVIKALSLDKAPGPDGFTVRFLQASWLLIRHELMSALDAFWHLDTRGFHNINEAIMTLLPKFA
jgi:hypothetical protein